MLPWYPYWHGCCTVAAAAECRSDVTGSIVISLQTLLFPLHHCDIHELELELEARAGAANALGPGEWTLEHSRWRMEEAHGRPGAWSLEHGATGWMDALARCARSWMCNVNHPFFYSNTAIPVTSRYIAVTSTGRFHRLPGSVSTRSRLGPWSGLSRTHRAPISTGSVWPES